jgi:uncharacterized protein (DUF608 family)
MNPSSLPSEEPSQDRAGCGCTGACGSGHNRRDFLKLLGVSGAASLAGGSLLLSRSTALAEDFNFTLIPANKNLDPAWVASLFARGTPTVVTGADLDRIGMPVGGIFCGQVYLSGDGRLWYWDIFNSPTNAMLAGGGGDHYVTPFDSTNPPVKQGFALKVGSGGSAQYRKLDRTGFANVSFTGQYPIGVVDYSDPACPVTAKLEAFSPFIPLNADDSGIPATIMEFKLRNTSGASVEVEIAGWLQNSACRFSSNVAGIAHNRVTRAADHTCVTGSVEAGAGTEYVLYDDFERTSYAPWVASGTAFGSGPVNVADIPAYQGNVNAHGQSTVNSHASAPGADVAQKDAKTGTLTSPTFTLNHDRIHFRLGGGNHAGQTCLNLRRANGTLLLSATGLDNNAMTDRTWDVTAYKGQQVYFQIVDNWGTGWGNIGVDYLRFSNLPRPDIAFDDFERTTYSPWTAAGTAFGSGPVNITNVPSYQDPSTMGQSGQFLVNSHASAPGGDVTAKDAALGTLTSAPFTIPRKCINFLIGGGNHAGQTCVNLLVGGQIVRTSTGWANNQLHQDSWNVGDLEGQTAQFQVVDNVSGAWGNIGVDNVVFSDTPAGGWIEPADAADEGTMSLALLNPQASDRVSNDAPLDTLANLFANLALNASADVMRALPGQLVGAASRPLTLAPGAEAAVTFVVAWHFPKTQNNNASVNAGGWSGIQGIASLQRYYATRFADASAVASYVAANYAMLAGKTRLWRDTWYDSTLPYWFLDRTFANTSTLATATCHRFSNGRFWGWEGIYCCPGTCVHVWHYAQAMGRVFPELERDQRQRVDLGLGFDSTTGQVYARAENSTLAAVDGQAGVVLRCYREHQMSADNSFLTANWPNIKQAMQWLITYRDANSDGILEGPQHNTLDADWYGKIAWLSGLYVAACKACEQMALEMGDPAFAAQLSTIAQAGANYIRDQLFHHNEYFIQLPDNGGNNVGSAWGCEIDQVFGQSWAFQLGLGRLLDQTKTLSALARLWKYNFALDAGGFRLNPSNPVSGGRPYAMPGEAGLVMSTFPDPAHTLPLGLGWSNMYFNECMSGFEHEVASHMIWEGMLQEGLAVTRAIHDRYLASKRNPYNEVECSDHYARAMASYGTHLAACGFEYHGPKGYLAFSPRLTPENFKAAFTGAEGWGTFTQTRSAAKQTHTIAIKHGQLKVQTLAFDVAPGAVAGGLSVTLNGSPLAASMSRAGDRVTVTLASQQTVLANQVLLVEFDCAGFTIVQGVRVSGGFQVTWASVPGKRYTLEACDTLPAASWTVLTTNITASAGATTSYTDASVGANGRRFYRIRLEQ